MGQKKMKKSEADVVLVSCVRTPYGRFGGVLRDTESVDLGGHAIREVLDRVNVPGTEVDEMFYGLSVISEPIQDGKGDVPDRRALLKAGLPPETLSMFHQQSLLFFTGGGPHGGQGPENRGSGNGHRSGFGQYGPVAAHHFGGRPFRHPHRARDCPRHLIRAGICGFQPRVRGCGRGGPPVRHFPGRTGPMGL